MTTPLFSGRKNFKRDFADYLFFILADTKGGRISLPFRKKKEKEENYPRIFLLSGAPGTGKSALINQYIDAAWGIGSEVKKTIKIVTLDCEEFLVKNVMMLRTLIQGLYDAFSNDEMGSAECFSEYAQVERKIMYIHEKVEHFCKREWGGEGIAEKAKRADGKSDRPLAAGNEVDAMSRDDGFRIEEDVLRGAAFTKWLRETGKLQDDELDIYENSDHRLSKALVNGIIQLSTQFPVILAIDAFDRVSNPEIEEWMRSVFLGALFEIKNNVIVILSGRNNYLHNYRNDFPEELLYAVDFDDFPLTRSDIADCARSYYLQLSGEQIANIEDATSGIPFIVRNILGLVKNNASLPDLLEALRRTSGTIEERIAAEIQRFLKFCPDETIKKKILHCACMRRLESALLAKLWNMAFADVGPCIAEYSAWYPLIAYDRTHERGHPMLREFLIKEMHAGADQTIISIVREFGTVAAPFFLDQLTQLTTVLFAMEKRYDDEKFQETLLSYCSALLWYDNEQLFKILPGILLECLQFNGTFAVKLLQCIDEFRIMLTAEQIRMIDIFINGIISYHPMGMWVETTPNQEETAMMGLFEEKTTGYNTCQKALLCCRRGELQYRLKDFNRAFDDFKESLAFAKESDNFKKTITDNLFALGNKLFSSGVYEKSIQTFKFVVELKPDDDEAWYTMGCAQTQCGNISDSILSYGKAVELKPDFYDAWHRLGTAYYGMEFYDYAVEALSRALTTKSENKDGWFTLGRAYNHLGRYHDALSALEKAGALSPDDKNIWIEFGAASMSAGRYEDAEISYNKAVRIDQEFHQGWFGLGQAQYRLSNFVKAMASFDKAIEKSNNNKDYFFAMALASHAAADYNAAIKYWGKVIETDPSNAQGQYHMALSLHALGQYSDAIQFYKKAIEGMPENYEVPHNLGRAYHAQGLYNDAVEMYRMALQRDPSKLELWDDLGLVFTEMNLYGDAIQAYKELVRLSPDWNNAWYHLGNTYYLIRHYENALQSYTKAVETAPDFYQGWGSIGLTYYMLGNFEKSIEASVKALSIKPDEFWVQCNLALSTLLSGNIPQASVEYDKIIAMSKNKNDFDQPIAALEAALVREGAGDQGKEILGKLVKASTEK
jgi:tetratricopeptide (TPR) repeat protein